MQANHRRLTTMTIAALMMIAVYPVQAAGAYIHLVNANGNCLQPINSSTTVGDAMVLMPCDPKNMAQVWIQSASSGKIHFINYNSHLCLDARGGAATGTPIQQWTCDSITNENWQSPASYGGPLISAVSGTSTYCMTPTGGQNGTPLQLTLCSTTILTGQIWFYPGVPDPTPIPEPHCLPNHPCP